MRVVLQRVSKASVTVNNEVTGAIQNGLLIFLGITASDSQEDIEWLTSKIIGLRIFNDDSGKMNHSIIDTNGEILCISQFTLFANTKKGNRPSYIEAARPEIAIPLYEIFVNTLSRKRDKDIQTGIFGADMQVQLVNDGPVTIVMDSKQRD